MVTLLSQESVWKPVLVILQFANLNRNLLSQIRYGMVGEILKKKIVYLRQPQF